MTLGPICPIMDFANAFLSLRPSAAPSGRTASNVVENGAQLPYQPIQRFTRSCSLSQARRGVARSRVL
jgi:hypothetical protein